MIAKFAPLGSGSQGALNPVMYLDSNSSRRDLMDAAEWRMGAVRDLLSVLSVCKTDDGGQGDIAKTSRALLLLVEDAESLYRAARSAA